MKTSRFNDTQIIAILKQAEAGSPVPERQNGAEPGCVIPNCLLCSCSLLQWMFGRHTGHRWTLVYHPCPKRTS